MVVNSFSPKNLYLTGLSVLLGLIFIFSGIVKLFPVEFLEFSFIETGFIEWSIAPFLARFLIGLEIFLGLLLVFNITLRGWTYKAVMALLVLFNIYLAYQLLTIGNDGNCGCFGDFIEMTPLEALIKNFILLGFVLILAIKHTSSLFVKESIFAIAALLLAFISPFIINPVSLLSSSNLDLQKTGYKLELNLLYSDPDNIKPSVDLKKGKWVISFLSLACPHCKIAAQKLELIKQKNPDIPIYMVLNGKESNLEEFIKETKVKTVPFSMFHGSSFIKLSGPQFPSIYLVSNETVEGKPNYIDLNQNALEAWLGNQ